MAEGAAGAGRERLTPDLLRRFGITRVGDLTGLDRLGIPVWFAARPNAFGLSVAQGKGLTPEQAQVSAIMEAIESAVAERPAPHVRRFAAMAEMAAEGLAMLALDGIARSRMEVIDPHRERGWVEGESLVTGQKAFAPFELVGLDMRADAPWDHAAFSMTSEGMGAGWSRDAALTHALLELIENDAAVAAGAFGPVPPWAEPLGFAPGRHAVLDALVRRVEAAGSAVRFHALGSRTGLPVVAA
jgi:ribosomal protein S12 methylthiotransferase accessory factor